MHHHNLAKWIPFALPLFGLAACGIATEQSAGLVHVDDLVGRIERVHVDAELGGQQVEATIDALHLLVAPDFAGDPLAAYTAFTDAVRQSEAQANELRSSVRSMKSMAEEVFHQWSSDLLGFTSAAMRQRSQARLENTRSRYRAILASVQPAQSSFDAFNLGMRDVGLFLANDFNATALSEVETEVGNLTDLAAELDRRFGASLEAVQAYLAAASRQTPTGGNDQQQRQ